MTKVSLFTFPFSSFLWFIKTKRLPPEVNRILFVKNLPYSITAEEIYDLFGKYGALRQVRIGNAGDTKGTAFVVYEEILDAKNAQEHLSGFNVGGRYLIVLYHNTKGKEGSKKQKK